MDEKRNQPVSVAMAANKGTAISRRQRHVQLPSRLQDQPSGRFDLRVLESQRLQIVLADVMIDDDLPRRAGPDHVGHRPQLRPGAGIQDHEHVGHGGSSPTARSRPRAQNPPLGIDESQIGRRRLTVDDQHLFAERIQHARHAQLAAQGVAVRANVAGQQERPLFADDFHETSASRSS